MDQNKVICSGKFLKYKSGYAIEFDIDEFNDMEKGEYILEIKKKDE